MGLGESNRLRAELARLAYPHRYTRTPRVAGAEDAHGNVTYTDGTPITGLPCRYAAQDRLRTDTGGRITISRPTLALPHDSALAVGEKVSAIADAAGTVLLAGPLAVEAIEPFAGFGHTLSKRAVLRAGDIR